MRRYELALLLSIIASLLLFIVSTASASAVSTGVLAWGDNEGGQLGDGTNAGPEDCYPGYPEPCSLVPVPVSGLSEAKSIAAGGSHGLALLRGGTVMSWGTNRFGQLGAGSVDSQNGEAVGPETCASNSGEGGTFPCSTTPVAVGGLSEVTEVAAGENSSFALLKDGTVMAWGSNEYGVLGNQTATISVVPVAVSGLSEVTQVAAGSHFSLALLRDGTVMAWGANASGQLGDATSTASDVPVAVSGLSEVVAIAAGGENSLALLRDGTVMAWGANSVGQLGDGTSTGPETCEGVAACSRTPIAVNGISEATSIAAGNRYFGGSPSRGLAVLKDGTVMAWGSNERGELGDGTETSSDVPVAVCAVGEQAPCAQHLSDVTVIAAGSGHTLALLDNGTVVAWGDSWQLGDGYQDVTPGHAIVGSDAPVVVDGLSEATAISAGGGFSLAFGTLASLPTITGLDPGSAPAGGGTLVRITGTNFTGVTAVRFGSTAASFTVESETEITAVAPSGTGMDYVTLPGVIVTPPGTVYVTVQTAAGVSPASSSRDLFVYGSSETESATGSGGGQSGGPGAYLGLGGSVLGANVFGPPGGESITPKALTRAQKLAIALKRCKKESKRKRAACAKQARRQYATTAKKANKQKRRGATTGRRIRAGQ